MNSEDWSKWVLVGDLELDPFTSQQISVCKEKKMKLQGAIMCNDEKQKDHPICSQVPFFPSFCNLDASMCISGLRENDDHFNHLISDLEVMKKDQSKK